MHELWSSASYEPHLLSLPFAFAPAALLSVIAYAVVMRGAPLLRAFLLAHSLAILPYAVAVMLAPSTRSPAAAEQLYRFAISLVPLAGSFTTSFQMALLGRFQRHRKLLCVLIASAMVWPAVGWTTSKVVDGVRWVSPGLWYGHAGAWAWLGLLHTLAITLPSYAIVARAARTSPRPEDRRQLRAALVANAVYASGLVDVGLAYGAGVPPIGWLLSGIGSLLVVRALIVDDLLRVRAIDTRAPVLVVSFAAGTLLGWVALSQLDMAIPWPLTALTLVVCFGAVRLSLATVAVAHFGARGGAGPLDRLLGQLVGRARSLTTPTAIAAIAIDVIDLGIGDRPTVLLAASDDWGWSTHTGERLADDRAPDPLVGNWLAEQRDPVFSDDLEPAPPELRELLAKLFADHAARAVVPVGSADELLALIVIPASGRPLGVLAHGFVVRAAERLAESLLHARMARRAAERAALAREVELAATVQADLLPGSGSHVHGAVTVVGSWRPATRCAGDLWIVAPLGEPGEPDASDHRPVLVAIGDVTGHGVAAAMVTAAVIAACDVAVRARGRDLDLGALVLALDAAVRRVGGGELAMTCSLAILDPAAGEIRFVSCGHPAAYLCRASERATELHALVGRGNPLGIDQPNARLQRRPLQAGDLVVWYTDGVVEAQDPSGAAFGDRRLQHLLRRLDRDRLTAPFAHDAVLRGVAAHCAGRPLADDETLVIAQIAAPIEAPIEAAR